ncbi:MAG: hypothetical protein ACI8PT_001086 [Gammaproteobacteria bacterium]|jgi:hypothetical protein
MLNAHPSPLMLLVQANVEHEHEDAFNAWYYHHMPKLLEIPGFEWARRYVNVVGPTKYLALYKIRDATYLDSLLGPDTARRDARANREREKFDALLGLSDVRSNVYEQLSGSHFSNPFLCDDRPLSVVMADCVVPEKEQEFNAWYDHSHVPNLVQIPGYHAGARFRVLEHDALAWRPQGPKYLALYELENLAAIPALSDPEKMCDEAAAELARWQAYGVPLVDNMQWNVYRPIATHYPFVQ